MNGLVARVASAAGLTSLGDLVAQIREDLEVHNNDVMRPGFQALAVHRFGTWRMRIRPAAVRLPFTLGYRAMERFCTNVYGIELPYGTRVGRRVVIEHQGGIIVHGSAVIGDECVLRQGVTLGARDVASRNVAPVLERGVDVGAGAKILGGVTVGEGACVGANAVVLTDVPPAALAVGVPARVITKEERAAKRYTPRE